MGQRCKRNSAQACVSPDIHSETFISLQFHTAIPAERQLSCFFRTQISFDDRIYFKAEEGKIGEILNRESMFSLQFL